MNTKQLASVAAKIYIGFSAFSLAYVSVLSVYDPQATMNMVATTLPNNDAISSIRGIYGGVGLVICTTLVYLFVREIHKGLVFLSMFWSAYALSRVITIWADGPLGDFGSQWLVIEAVMGLSGLLLLRLYKSPSVG